MGKGHRKLHDLYQTAEEVTFDDLTGDPITVQVVKLNRPDKDAVIRRASAARATALIGRNDPNGDAYLAIMSIYVDIDDPADLISLIASPQMAEAMMSLEAELAAEKEWSDDDYLEGLRDAWNGTDDEPGMEARWLESVADGGTEDPEAKQVFDELSRFNAELANRIEMERLSLHDAYVGFEIADLRDRAVKSHMKIDADGVFNDEFIRQRAFYSVRDVKDRRKRYFETLADWDDSDEMMVQRRLIDAYDRIAVEGVEGKDSPGTPGSSPSSEPPAEEVASTDSDLVGATASRTSPTSS